MGLISKIIVRIVLNGAALWIAKMYLPGFILTGGLETLAMAAFVFALLNTFIRPILMLITAPLRWITFGIFTIAVYMAIIWLGDYFLTELTIMDLKTLFLFSLLIGLANAIL